MKCKIFKLLIVEDIIGNLTKEKKNKLLNHVKSCKDCNDEWMDLKNTDKISNKYFEKTKASYNKQIESNIINTILKPEGLMTKIKKNLSVFKYLKPALITVSLIFILISYMFISTTIKRKAVTQKIISIIELNQITVEFVLINNIENIVPLYIQQENSITNIVDDNEFSLKIQYAITLYLKTQINEDYIYENREVIVDLIDKYTNNYLKYFKDNYNKILI